MNNNIPLRSSDQLMPPTSGKTTNNECHEPEGKHLDSSAPLPSTSLLPIPCDRTPGYIPCYDSPEAQTASDCLQEKQRPGQKLHPHSNRHWSPVHLLTTPTSDDDDEDGAALAEHSHTGIMDGPRSLPSLHALEQHLSSLELLTEEASEENEMFSSSNDEGMMEDFNARLLANPMTRPMILTLPKSSKRLSAPLVSGKRRGGPTTSFLDNFSPPLS